MGDSDNNHIEDRYKCKRCNSSFKRRSALTFHESFHTKKLSEHYKKIKSDECSTFFRKESDYQNHISKTHVAIESFKHKHCDLIYDAHSDLDPHILTHEAKSLSNGSYVSTSNKVTAQFKCSNCDSTFTSKSSLNKHLLSHAKTESYKCHVCAATFSFKTNLRRHKLVHTSERPYKCLHCDSAFKYKYNLRAHTLTHTGLKPFKCSLCDSAFRLKSALQQHMMIHTGERRFTCEFCGTKYRNQTNLKHHLLIHTNEMPFKCIHCPYSARQKGTLKSHVLTKHLMRRLKEEEINDILLETIPRHVARDCDAQTAGKSDSKSVNSFKNLEKILKGAEIAEDAQKIVILSDNGLRKEVTLSSPRSLQDMLSHSKELPYKCSRCDTSFQILAQLKEHFLKFHSCVPKFTSVRIDFS